MDDRVREVDSVVFPLAAATPSGIVPIRIAPAVQRFRKMNVHVAPQATRLVSEGNP